MFVKRVLCGKCLGFGSFLVFSYLLGVVRKESGLKVEVEFEGVESWRLLVNGICCMVER